MIDRSLVLDALKTIVRNKEEKSLTWAINYAHYCIAMIEMNHSDEDVRAQLLYVVGNITRWRGQEAELVRKVLKEAIKK